MKSRPSFALVVLAESVKLSLRTTARLGWVVSLGLGAVVPITLLAIVSGGIAIFGGEAEQFFQTEATTPLVWALRLRNFFVIPTFLAILTAQSMAGELGDRTLREAVLGPVPRFQVLFAKVAALIGWDALSLALTFVVATVLSVGAFGIGGPWLAVLMAYLVNLVTDTALIALALLIATLTRSVVATLGGLLLGLILDMVVTWGLFVLSSGRVVSTPWVVAIAEQYPLFLYSALGVWSAPLPGYEGDLRSYGSLGVVLGVSLLGSLLWFRRTDVP